MTTPQNRERPIVLVIDFHHARGPEIEFCIADDGVDPTAGNDWSLLPFMALSDGAHASTEDFSYFTLCRTETSASPATSLFGISCSRQIDSSRLLYRPPDVTRSTVQKAVVVVTDNPTSLGQLREKLSVVTSAWFAQRDFSDFDILKKFREGLVINFLNETDRLTDSRLGLSLREMIHEYKYQTLVLFKSLLLQPKMLFFGSRCERLCLIQFSLISLIPGLINNMQDCADPAFDSYAQTVERPTSLKTSERSSLLAYMGLPLQIFGKGSMFGPYTPLQQLDLLADYGTKSYVVGSTNSLLLQQKDRYSDILINLDEDSVVISSPSLRTALTLSPADRRWIDFLTQIINETWDDAHPEQPKTHGYMGSEEFIRLQFEEYLLALLSSMKYHEELNSSNTRSRTQLQTFNIEGDPALEFNPEFLALWQTTSNYALFKSLTTDSLLFSIVEPRHPCAGGLTIDDIQRRLSQQVAELHLDDRVREGREALNKHLAIGQKKVSAAFNSFWSDIEAMREAQRKRNEEKALHSQQPSTTSAPGLPPSSAEPATSTSAGISGSTAPSWFANRKAPSVDMTQAQASVNAVGQKAGAYFSSWSSWASDKRKEWQQEKDNKKQQPSSAASSVPADASSTPSLSVNSPLPIVTELTTTTTTTTTTTDHPDRGRRQSMQHRREGSLGISRSQSRRKRWSSLLRRRESEDFGASYRAIGDDADPPFPKSPLSKSEIFFPASNDTSEPHNEANRAAPGGGPSINADLDTEDCDAKHPPVKIETESTPPREDASLEKRTSDETTPEIMNG
ncbi:hypothetical protein ASPZODRAFT_128477 [Penicilliopsis zonata CBS 506.65]|uniref:UDENN domain-containing protein n=1 Tax=Penicilliopsis zonata CBS 506.65 TaxID=1073090 RepID=A0A1L9SRR2_9EURO|nr:hypothetical protein ASPZODRAFT_128477 [Penicilliopsis zonata CBS 506.65]OJJ49910.1 hypothetical protein ASPZODRAFT_128477 [Penicilliopsis zonata CBS 506.65]